TVVIGSGDGTIHDLINAKYPLPLKLVIVPSGTANALYASLFHPVQPQDRLRSVDAYLNKSVPIPLSIARTTITASQNPILSVVVVSTSLHASILHHSEALRKEHPGLERFKIAAEQNAPHWYNASVKLHGKVEIYDPSSNTFVSHPENTLQGPFVYFLSTVNVDRLEPAFRISPLARTIPPPISTCDIVIIRPLRHPSISADSTQSRADFVATTWKTLTGAYADGAHVHFTYRPDGSIDEKGEHQGPSVVEYIRCAGWEWIPDPDDHNAHLLCADGSIFHIPPHGTA
ncbi:hypothetical protein CPC08DRAFT_620534, partial [Agrocybe pediades]